MPPEKEVGFFSNEEWFARGWPQFCEEFFSKAPMEALWGKVTPQYMAYSHVPERIFKQMPRVKLIAILRNPVDRAFSHYRMAVRLGAEKRSFADVFSEEQKDVSSINFLTLGQYGRILARFLEYFPREQLLVLLADDLERVPKSVLDSVFGYLGVERRYTPKNLDKRYHQAGMKQRFPWLVPTARHIYPLWWFWKAIPERRRRVVRFWFLTQANTVPEAPVDLDSNLRRQLVNFYQEDVLLLEHLLGKAVPWSEFHGQAAIATPTSGNDQ
jgi:hypothetical protein